MFFAIPFFKNTKYLEETLKSVLAQTDSNWTAIVLDDSVDASEAQAASGLVREINDSRIQYLRNSQNLGLAENWNQGLALANGKELAVILHADDRLKPDYIVELRKLAKKYPDAVAYFCKSEIIGANGEMVFSMADFYKKFLLPKTNEIILSGKSGIAKLIPGNFIFCPSLCYRMTVVGEERFRLDRKMVVDFDFILRILKKGGTLVGTYEKPLFEYRRHTENTTLSLTKNLTRFHEEIALYRELADWLLVEKEAALAILAREMKVVKLNLLFQILKSLLSFQFKNASQEIALLLKVSGKSE